MQSNIRVISIDCETTALSHIEGYPWEIGFAWTDYPLNFVVGTVYKEAICNDLIEIPIPKQWWNAETWKFCYTYNKDRMNKLALEAGKRLPFTGHLDLEMHIRKNYQPKLKQIVENLVRGLEKNEYIVVLNHPDFDMPFLQQVWPNIKESGFYYRNVKDMQSLIEGHLGRKQAAIYLKASKEAIGGVKHSARDDATNQLKTLIRSGAIKK